MHKYHRFYSAIIESFLINFKIKAINVYCNFKLLIFYIVYSYVYKIRTFISFLSSTLWVTYFLELRETMLINLTQRNVCQFNKTSSF